jgi:hypothetical protein
MAASRNFSDQTKTQNFSPLINTDNTDRKIKTGEKTKSWGANENLPTSAECYASAKIESRALDVEGLGRLTFLINLSLRLETF